MGGSISCFLIVSCCLAAMTYYKTASSEPTPPPTLPPADTCFRSLRNVVLDEGNAIGEKIITTSATECEARCTGNSGCKSFTLCPQWTGCWMKDGVMTGSEATHSLGECKTYYKTTCSEPTSIPTSMSVTPTSPPPDTPYCGIAVSVYECRAEVERLRAIDPAVGNSFERMCMGYGGTHPPAHLGKTFNDSDSCTLNINNDCDHWFPKAGRWRCAENFGISKNPDECHNRYFFLWDEPMTQGLSAAWAADQWKTHVDTWGPQIASMRSRGVQVTTPLFTDHQGPAQEKFQQFFFHCGSGCSDPNSKYYIDVLATNQWLLSPRSGHSDQEEWIRREIQMIRESHGNRPVVLSNFAWLGANTADQAVEVINKSRIFDRSWSGLEAVFYFAALDYGGGTSNNFLYSQTSAGSTVGAALISRCQTYGR